MSDKEHNTSDEYDLLISSSWADTKKVLMSGLYGSDVNPKTLEVTLGGHKLSHFPRKCYE